MYQIREHNKMLFVVRWVTRIISLGFVGMFLLFFIGEGSINGFINLNVTETLLMIFVPLLFVIGLVISFKRELFGGILMLFSVIGFNLVDIIATMRFSGEIEFAFLLIPGVIFILLSYLSKKSGENIDNLPKLH